MPHLSLNKLKAEITKTRRIKNYKNMSKETLLSAIDESESVVSGNNFDKKIREDFKKIKTKN